MASDVQAVAVAIEEGKRYEHAERERRIGLTYALSGATTALIFSTYGLLTLAPWHVPGFVFAIAWTPFVALTAYARRKLFRHLPTRAQEITGFPPELWFLFVGAWVGAPSILSSLGMGRLVWPAEGLVTAVLYAVQAACFRDRIHAAMAAVVALFAIGVAPLPGGWQALVLAWSIGGTLLLVGIARYRRAR